MSATFAPPVAAPRTVESLQDQLVRAAVLIIGLLVHSYNMFGYPLFLGDEGIYMSQAWAVLRTGQLAGNRFAIITLVFDGKEGEKPTVPDPDGDRIATQYVVPAASVT